MKNKKLAFLWRIILSGPALVFQSLLFYMITLAPGIYGFDSAELSSGVHSLGIIHPPGYPLYILIGKVFALLPFGTLAYRLNIMSAVFASLTVMFLYYVLSRLLYSRVVAWAAAFIFAVSNYFWQMALVAEVYTLHTFSLALELLILLLWINYGKKRFLFLFSFIYGLSLCNHTSGILFAPGFTWLIVSSRYWDWKWRSARTVISMFSFFLIGLLPYIYLPLASSSEPPLNYVSTYYNIDLSTLYGIWWMMSGKAYHFFAFGYSLDMLPAEISHFVNFLWRNFLGLGVIFGILGLLRLFKTQKKLAIGLALIFLGNAVFYINYRVIDKDTMFLPAYLIWAVLMAAGIQQVLIWLNILVTSRSVWQIVKSISALLLVALPLTAAFLNWRWVDLSKANGPARFASEVMQTAEPNAVVMAQWSPAVVLEYYQLVEGQRPDLVIHNRSRSAVARFYLLLEQGMTSQEILKQIAEEEKALLHQEILHRPIHIVEYDSLFATDFEYLPAGNYYQLVLKEDGSF